jgi:hypothetical protein
MEVSVAESRILKKVIRTWIESEYGNLEKLNHLKQNIDDSTWIFAKRLNSEIGKSVSLDFILETIIETILILYPEYDAQERKRQEIQEAERKRKAELEAIAQRKQREAEAIRQREEEQRRLRREAILNGDIGQIRMIVQDCVCKVLEEEPREGIDDEHVIDLSDEGFIFGYGVGIDVTTLDILESIELAIKSEIDVKIQLLDDLKSCSTINDISKSISFYLKQGRYPNKSRLHDKIIEIKRLIDRIQVSAETLKQVLKTGNTYIAYTSPLENKQEIGSALAEFLMRHAPPWSGSRQKKLIENLINATQVLIECPNYSDSYGYDTIESIK